MIDLDFSDVKGVQETLEEYFTPVPDADYLLLVTDAQLKPGNSFPGVNCRFTLVEDAKKNVFRYFHLDPSNKISMAYLKEFLSAVYGETLSGWTPSEENVKDLIGRQFVGAVTTEPRKDDKDKMQNVVTNFSPAV